jgi:catechol 1,2-dioxygenase
MDADERLRLALDQVSAALREVVEKLQITEPELRAAIAFLGEVSLAGQLPLLSDVLGVSVAVDDVTYGAQRQGTASSVEGPFYRLGAPVRTQICRDDEPGDVCFVSGRVADATTGAPLAGALLDVWQAGAGGKYEHEDPELTGRLEKHDDPEQLSRRGLDRPFFTYAYDFALVPAASKEGAGDGS